MKGQKGQQQRIIISVIAVLVLAGAVVAFLDWREVRRVMGQADWEPALVALLFTAISYGCLSYGFAVVNRIFGISLGQRDLLEIGFVSITLNHVMGAGGLAGYSLRLLLMRRRGLVTGDILAASLFHSYFNNLVLAALLPIGLVYLLVSHPLSGSEAVGVGVAAGLLLLILALATAMVFVKSMRSTLLRALGNWWRWTMRRDIQPSLEAFNDTLSRGVAAIQRRPGVLALPLGLMVADWAASVATLGFCFDALGRPVGPGVLLTGFAVGISIGALSMVPGGLGVQEGSMAGAYVLLGVSFEQAVLASVLFRVVYYLIPFGVSFGFYWRLLRQVGKARA